MTLVTRLRLPLPISRTFLSARCLAAGLVFIGSAAMGADGIWDVSRTGGPLSWADSLNWVGGTIPGTPGGAVTDKATFNAVAAATIVEIDAGRTIRSLDFGSGTSAYTIGGAGANGGNALTLNATGAMTILAGATSTVTVNAPLILGGAYTFTNNAVTTATTAATAKLNVTGNISNGTAGAATLTLSGSVGTRNASSLATALDQANTISGAISNGTSGGVLSLLLNGTNAGSSQINAWNLTSTTSTYSGATTVNSNSTLYFSNIGNTGDASALGTGLNGTVVIGGYLIYTGAVATTNRTITGAGGNLYNNGTGTLTLTGTVALNAGSAITFRGNNTIEVTGLITGTTARVSKTGGNTLILSNANNSFGGNFNVSAGIVSINSIGNASANSTLGAGTTIFFGQNQVGENVGTLRFTGASGGSSNRNMIINSGTANTVAAKGTAVLENTVAGQTLTMSGTVKANGTTVAAATNFSALTLTGAGNGIMTNVIGGLTGAGLDTTLINLTLTKSGAGTWELRQGNYFYADSVINGGTLLATNTSGSALGTGGVVLSGSGTTLGGTGFVTGSAGKAINIAATTRLMVGNSHGVATGVTSGGYTGAASQFSIGTNADVAITLAGILQFDLFGNDVANTTLAEADRLLVSTTATTMTLGGTISVADVSGTSDWRANGGSGWSAGTWQLINWTGASSAVKNGTFTYSLPTNPLAIGYTWDTSNFLSTGEISVAKIADANIHIWVGATGGSWVNGENWTAGTMPTSANTVIFDNYAGNTSTFIDGDKSVKDILFTGAVNYSIGTGTGGVLYAFGNTLEVQGGTQNINTQLRAATSGDYYIVNNGTLNLASNLMFHRQSGSGNLNIVISGSGTTNAQYFTRRVLAYDVSVVKNGTGTLTLNGGTDNNADSAGGSYITGTFTINGGKVRINDERNLGGDPLAYNAAQLTLNGGTLGAYADVTIDDTNRGVTLGANGGGIDVEGNFTLTMASVVTGAGALNKTGTGTFAMTAANTYTGTTTVSAGTLLANNTTGSATGTGNVQVTGTGTLGGTGIVATAVGNTVSVASGASLMVGATHGVAGTAQDLQLGDSTAGTLTLTGTLKFDLFGAGSSDAFGSISYNTLGTANDLLELNTTGTISLANAIIQIAAPSGAAGWFDGATWKLIDWTNATYSSLDTTGITLGTTTLSGYYLTQSVQADGYYITATVVPEPSRMVLLGVGLAVGILRRRRAVKSEVY